MAETLPAKPPPETPLDKLHLAASLAENLATVLRELRTTHGPGLGTSSIHDWETEVQVLYGDLRFLIQAVRVLSQKEARHG